MLTENGGCAGSTITEASDKAPPGIISRSDIPFIIDNLNWINRFY